ncbi:metallophosphoesterase [Dehalobacter sp. TeCB1]|uniref:metallophosphoesterase n=1 Tax=Dehalobacter sp. TeCB1 TaxID=1843715 RepID=UPI00083A6076|nr:metallophosphoesterase [Dehalobacter sp. TeCB1]OCZ54294.1 hypothetical protein A7D23_05870 [Dehalobacter sp. TeCB1]
MTKKDSLTTVGLGNNSISYTISHPPAATIVFISDLHFDYTEEEYMPNDADKRQEEFIDYVKEHYTNCILCLAGDFYDNYKKTLSFIQKIEENKIAGFFVLGNHDYWNDGTKSYDDIIRLFDDQTQNNNYIHLLITGKKYYVDDICVIGDTGWTSFRRKNQGVSLKQFRCFPDAKNVKDFDPKKIRQSHETWVTYANEILSFEKKVIIITHFPMVDFTEGSRDCWWSSQTTLTKQDNYWAIFGHKHDSSLRENNHISSQRGYENYSSKYLELTGKKQYSSQSFGTLEKVNDNGELIISNKEGLFAFYSPLIISAATADVSLITGIKKRGFKRCAANKVNFSALATSPEEYLERVKHFISGYLRNTYIDYTYLGYISKRTIDAVFSAISIMEKGDFTNPREFITAAVVTGFVYNRKPELIEHMRPVDDYDVLRFYLMFLTMKEYNIGIDFINSVRKHRKNYITFGNVDIYIPSVNECSLSIEEVMIQLKKTPLLPGNV